MPLASSTATRSTTTAVLGLPGTALFFRATTGLLWLTTLLFASRRLAGALVQPLSLPVLVGLALCLVAITVLLRKSDGRLPYRVGTSLALGILALAVSLPGTSLLGLVLLWTILGGEEVWAWEVYRRGRAPGGHSERSEESGRASGPTRSFAPLRMTLESTATACSAARGPLGAVLVGV